MTMYGTLEISLVAQYYSSLGIYYLLPTFK